MLEAELTAAGHKVDRDSPEVTFAATIHRFEAHTDTTPLYWDIIGNVSISLATPASRYLAQCVERTYLNPSRELIAKVMSQCQAEIGKQFRSDSGVAAALRQASNEDYR